MWYSTFHVLELKKILFNLCNLFRWQCRSLTNIGVIIDYGYDYMQYMELFPHHCIALLLLVSVKTFQLLFSFFVLKKISQVQQVCWNDPSSITFSSVSLRLEYSIVFAFSRNSSQLARLFKVKVALSPDLNTAHWFARMDLSASVQKQQGHLSASICSEMWTRDASKVDNTDLYDWRYLGFRSRYMWRIFIFLNVSHLSVFAN